MVRGTIRASDTGAPLRDMVVAAYDTTGTLRGSATSDPTGTYILTLPAGSYRVLAYDPMGLYATMFGGNAESFETTPVTTVGASDTVIRDFSLVLGGTVTGFVTSSRGVEIPGAVVEAYNLSGTRRAFTQAAADGRYSIVLPPGEYKLVAYDPAGGYAISFYQNVRTFPEAARVRVTASTATANIDFRLETPGSISGRVVDAATGLPLSGVTVYAFTPAGSLISSTNTDAAGAFRLTLPPGGYRLAAADPSRTYAPAFNGAANSFDNAPVINLTPGMQQSNVQFSLARGARIAGRVVNAAGTPLANITVAAYNLDGTIYTSAITRADGTYELLVAAGAYKLVAFDLQLAHATQFFGGVLDFNSSGPVGIATGQSLGGFDFALVRGGRITGTVRDGSQPRAGIVVAAYNAAGLLIASANTAADGTYALVVPPGDYRVVGFDPSFRYAPSYAGGAGTFDQTVPRSIAADSTTVVDLLLTRGFVVSGEVVDENGQPISGVNVFAVDAAGNRIAGGTSVDGHFTLAVPSGSYKFLAADPAGRYAVNYFDGASTLGDAELVSVSDNGTTTLRFTLHRVVRRRAIRH